MRQYNTGKIEAVQQTLEKRCRKYYGGDFRRIEVVMLSIFSPEVREYQNRETMRSARSPLPLKLIGVAVDSGTNEYIIEEACFSYRMDAATFVALKQYYADGKEEALSSWYEQLDDLARKKVVRIVVPEKGEA